MGRARRHELQDLRKSIHITFGAATVLPGTWHSGKVYLHYCGLTVLFTVSGSANTVKCDDYRGVKESVRKINHYADRNGRPVQHRVQIAKKLRGPYVGGIGHNEINGLNFEPSFVAESQRKSITPVSVRQLILNPPMTDLTSFPSSPSF